MGGFGGFPGGMPGRPPPPGMDPRLMARPPMGGPGFQQMPPHIAVSLGLARGPMPPGMGSIPPPPMGIPGGPRGSNGVYLAGFDGFPVGRMAPPGMPPQMYQQLMSMPPHIQQQVLAGQGFRPGMPPPRSPYDMPGTPGTPGSQNSSSVGAGGDGARSQSPAATQFAYYAVQQEWLWGKRDD
ncbi:hypothetical protein [Sporisorium scitamineum]|uniref:Uncharacterized protein n=1 Tax=Sporisorium scitamineum TaxID=49012 RepID=A0A0F7RWB6_9BASI|nr:hypothetical protein [Sporisorium scitamineum]